MSNKVSDESLYMSKIKGKRFEQKSKLL